MKDVDPGHQVESLDVEDIQKDESLTAADRMDLIANQALANNDTETAAGETDT
jgi:hypothetical protein